MISEIEEEQITKKPSFEPPQYGIMGRFGNITNPEFSTFRHNRVIGPFQKFSLKMKK